MRRPWRAGCALAGQLGFAGGCNLGLAAAEGDVAVVLDNGALTTPGRLQGLRRALAEEPGVGIAGPRSSRDSDDQIIPHVPYDEAPSDAVDAFAAGLPRDHAGQGREAPRISGLCMAIARPVLDTIGGFDTRFEIGNMEDEDHALRARLAGIRLWVADDACVHHFGHRTFTTLGEDYEARPNGNAMRYAVKWGLPVGGDPRGITPSRGFDPALDRIPLAPA